MTASERNNKARHIVGMVLRMLLGATFIVSAAAKLWSVDQFELYIYSYPFFSLNLSFVVARLCIGLELALGIMLIAGLLRRWTLMATALLLLLFSIFLAYAALAGRNDSCQCFGNLADMPPALSLAKNAILLVVTLLCTKLSATGGVRRWHLWFAVGITVVGLAVPFVISVPDNWMFGASNERYDADLLQDVIDGHQARDGGKIIAFVTPGCPYCAMTRQKLDYMSQRHNIPADAIIYIEPSDTEADTFLRITHGATPMVLLLDGGEVVATFHYRNIDERKIVRTLISR